MTDFCSCGIPWQIDDFCDRCKKPISHERLGLISKQENKVNSDSRLASNQTAVNTSSPNQLEVKLEDVLIAVNRTTHAVRAFVLFLFYQLSAITIAYAIYILAGAVGNSNEQCSDMARGFGNCPPNGFLLFVAFIVWVAGVVYSSNVGWKEIKKSELP